MQFAAAILHRPRFAILDEPFSGLDPLNQELFLGLVRELRDSGATVLLSAHQMSLVERIADRVFVMHLGRELLHGTVPEIRERWSAGDRLFFRVRGAADLRELQVHAAVQRAVRERTAPSPSPCREVIMMSPQTWVDGKILGLVGAALVGTGFLLAGGALLARVLPMAFGARAFTLPPVASDFGILALVVLITTLGVAMWFAFMAAIAATIDDPNSAMRSLLLFIPMLPLGLAFPLISKADSVYFICHSNSTPPCQQRQQPSRASQTSML